MAKKKPKVQTHLYAQPSVRRGYDWTPSMLRQAEMRADAGDLSLAADLCECMLSDEKIMSAARTLADDLFGRPVSFEAGNGKAKSKQTAAAKALEAEEDWFVGWPENELKAILIWGLLLGVCPWQNRWTSRLDEDAIDRVVPNIEQWNPKHLRFDWQTREWSIQLDGGANKITVAHGDSKWGLFMPYGATRPWANGLWRGLARWWLLKRYAESDWALYSERHGGGFVVGIAPDGSSDAVRQEFAADVDNLVANGTIAIPAGFDVKIVESTAKNHDTFVKQIEMADRAISIAWTGHNLTTEVDGGSFAAATVGDARLLGRTRGNAETMSTALHSGSIVWWAEYNFADRNAAPWPTWKVEPPKDLKSRADTLNVTADMLGKLDGLGIDVSPLIEEFGLSLRKKKDEPILTPPPAPPVPNEDEPKDDGDEELPKVGDKVPGKGYVRGYVQRNGVTGVVYGSTPPRATPSEPKRDGFIAGTIYADEVTERATTDAVPTLGLSDIVSVVEQSADYDECRKRLRAMYRGLDARGFADVLHKAILIADLAGRWAIRKDL